MAINMHPSHPRARSMRWILLTVVTGSLVFLVPWIGYLSVSLPSERQVNQWDIAWVGFDFALAAAIGMTAWNAWRRRQVFIPWAMITGTLLVADAWFDVVLDWNSPDLWFAALSAGIGELPLAALLFYAAWRVLRLTIERAWVMTGHTGPAPRLSRVQLGVTTGWQVPDTAGANGPGTNGSDVQRRTGIDTAYGSRNRVAQRVDAEA